MLNLADFTCEKNALIPGALGQASHALAQSGIANAALDASLLLAHTLSIPREQLLFLAPRILNDNEISRFSASVSRRLKHEPVAYIIGHKEFWSLDFFVTHDTLIPRPDSETLIRAALERVLNFHTTTVENAQEKAKPIALLDIGTGTGCLLLALLNELPELRGIGIDNSERALHVARKNAKRHGLDARAEFIESHWCDALHGTFDLILSNPPYITEGARATLMPDVLHFEPASALFAGADGLDAYRVLAPQVAQKLNPGGHVLFEVGEGQAKAVAELLNRQGLKTEAFEKDFAGIERCVIARKAK